MYLLCWTFSLVVFTCLVIAFNWRYSMIQGHCRAPAELIYSTADSCKLIFFLTYTGRYDTKEMNWNTRSRRSLCIILWLFFALLKLMNDALSHKCKSSYTEYLCSLKMTLRIVSSPDSSSSCYLFSIPSWVAAGQLILVSRACGRNRDTGIRAMAILLPSLWLLDKCLCWKFVTVEGIQGLAVSERDQQFLHSSLVLALAFCPDPRWAVWTCSNRSKTHHCLQVMSSSPQGETTFSVRRARTISPWSQADASSVQGEHPFWHQWAVRWA